ncbi:four-carbon acid sugar kinase family protein [Phytoactinopolyspora alkaliphila]|uniref:3-oxo-tetronate kinase n=1 Tax=Phytoactinopolyspora alkaliphila TaxID=1783498 RepID=A0A6N9YP21_9ACTN|nr:3-oxo-tetronate kinase [Phytoactinopolyspora alkaliphila]NED96697.1 four-carbon acid sugar kinase family protein [Phytoactinopolyspora alkaliphila]
MTLGAVADDLTGAIDLATNLAGRGFRTVVAIGVPADEPEPGTDAIVAALKTRSVAADDAVAESLNAVDALARLGCRRYYVKYCSTFDSTAEGNIGPVSEAICDRLGVDSAVVVPSFPAAGRTVYQGRLFVHDKLLHESHMKDHPLNPMRESDVVSLLRPQTRHPVGAVRYEQVHAGPDRIRAALDAETAGGARLVVVDAVTNEDLVAIAAATEKDAVVTGGSGLAAGFIGPRADDPDSVRSGGRAAPPRAVIVGSVSAASQGQVEHARAHLPFRELDVTAARDDLGRHVEALGQWAQKQWNDEPERPVLISSGQVRGHDPELSRVVEHANAALAVELARRGARQFVIGGGETSGAVINALGIRQLTIGRELAPGVAWASGTAPRGGPPGEVTYDVILKSGNFGAPDLFTAAWKELA